jgi:precorrin-4/cobalt-precorrin-4 C11-methyltransferase
MGWDDEIVAVVPLTEMAAFTSENNLVRTTLYVISPALAKNNYGNARSRLYHPEYTRLFRSAE